MLRIHGRDCMPLIIDLDTAFYNNVLMIYVNDCRYVSVGDVVHFCYDPPEFAMVYRDDNDGRFAPPEGFDLVGTCILLMVARAGGLFVLFHLFELRCS